MADYLGLVRTIGFKNLILKGAKFAYRRTGIQGIFVRYYEYDEDPPHQYGSYQFQWENLPFLSGDWKFRVEKFLISLPDDIQQQLISEAVKITEGDYRLFSYHVIHSEVPDFNFDPLENVTWPTGKHSSNYFQFDKKFGDIKRVWELNRMQFLDPLICGYLLAPEDTKKQIRDKMLQIFDAWILQSPHERSVAWACSQEISIRCIKLLFLFRYLDIYLDEKRSTQFRNLFVLSAIHVLQEIGYAKTQRNNHAITESVFLLIFGQVFPESKHAQRCYREGLNTLRFCLDDQFFSDGTYIQNSITYHRFALQSLLLAYQLVRDETVLIRMREVFELSLQFFQDITFSGDGEFPNYGPNDGAMLFNWANSDYRDLRPIQNCLAIICRQAVVYPSPSLILDTLLSISGSDQFINNKYLPENREKGFYEIGGLYVIKNDLFSVLFKCATYSGRFPSQNDQLHVDLWVDGKPFFNDSGTYEYFGRNGVDEFHRFLSTSAHNTIQVDGLDQMDKGPRFAWYSVAEGKQIHVKENKLIGESFGYVGRINSQTVHRRTISLNSHVVVIDDKIFDTKDNKLELFWHLDSGWRCSKNEMMQIECGGAGLIRFECDEELSIQVNQTPQSRYYGEKTMRDTIVVTVTPTTDTCQIRTIFEYC